MNRGRRCRLIFITAAVLAMSFALASAEEARFTPNGPFNIRNQMPIHLFYLAMPPDRARPLEKGNFSAEAGYHASNTIISQQDPWPLLKPYERLNYWMLVDAELNRFYADLRYGLLDNLEIGINVPYFDYSGGYLDSFIEHFEDITGIANTPARRKERAKNDYAFRLDHNGQNIITDYSKPDGLGEIALRVKHRVWEETKAWPACSLRLALKLPSSSSSSGIVGSEEWDYGFGLLADKKLLERLIMYLNLDIIFIGKPELLDKIDMDSQMVSGLLGIEFLLTERTSLLFQAAVSSSPYKTGVPAMKKDGALLTIGFNHNFTKKLSWQFAIDENINKASPDFGLFTSFKYKN